MFHSAEIRWFFPGPPNPSVVDWFAASELAADEDPRIDTYLVLPGCISAGVKVREGHLEVKALTSAPEAVSHSNGITGKQAAWVKWSSGIAGAPLLAERNGPEQWAQVEKARLLRLFSLRDDAVAEQQAGEFVEAPGCQVELARLRLLVGSDSWSEADDWWSVCFEAFGEAPLVTLNKVVSDEVFSRLAGSLGGETSMSYPDWLSANAAYP